MQSLVCTGHWSLVTRTGTSHSHRFFYLCRSLVFAARRDLSSHLRSSCLLAFVWEKPDSRELRNVQRDSRCLVAPVAVLVVFGPNNLEWRGCVSVVFSQEWNSSFHTILLFCAPVLCTETRHRTAGSLHLTASLRVETQDDWSAQKDQTVALLPPCTGPRPRGP